MHEENWGGMQPPDELGRLRRRLAEQEENKKRRERVERALRVSEEHFRSLVENSQDVITILDKEGIFPYNNPTFGQGLGYNDEELLGRNALEFIHPGDLAVMVEKFAYVIANPGIQVMAEFRLRHRDGTWLYL